MELTQQDLDLIQKYLLRHFTVEELDGAGVLDRPPDRFLRRQLAELDYEFFCLFYLPHHFSKPLALMHREFTDSINELLCTLTTRRVNEVDAWPRGFAKTTWGTLGLPLWCVVAKKRHFIIVLSAAHDQAKGQLTTVKTELEHNDRIHEDFGDLRGSKWQEDDIVCNNGGFETNIVALGARMKVRGRKFRQWRPDLIICDDLEDILQVQSETQRTLMERWFMRSVMRAVQANTIVLVLGTVLHFDSLLKRLLDNPLFRARKYEAVISWAERQDLWDEWRVIVTDLSVEEHQRKTRARAFFEANKAEMLEGAQSAWPEGASYYDLMVEWATIGAAAFASEMQNNPLAEEEQPFKITGRYRQEWRPNAEGGGEVWLIPLNGRPAVPLFSCAVFGFCDPSLGKTTRSDMSAIIAVAKAPYGQGFVIHANIKRRKPSAIFDAIIDSARVIHYSLFGVEAVQFQALFAGDLADKSQEAGVYLPVKQVNQHANKQLRIISLQPDIENEYILFPEHGCEVLIEQMQQWPAGRYDDGPDALEGAWRLAKQWEHLESVGITAADLHEYGTSVYREQVKARDPFGAYEGHARHMAQQQLEALQRRLEDEGREPTEEEARALVALREAARDVWVPIMVA